MDDSKKSLALEKNISKTEETIHSISPLSEINTANSNTNSEIIHKVEQLTTSEMWDEIGYHKTIAGFWYNLVLTLFGIGLSMLLAGYLISFFFPFPESLGMKDIAFGYFNLLFLVFDIGTGAVMGRFIPEVNIKDTERMIHYTQYFIWYQMITGLIQTTIVSIYALFYASQTSMAYTVWLMLIASTTQYPGFLWVFHNLLGALQQYNKSRILEFITSTVLQNVSSYFFVYLGRIYGNFNPIIGPVLGIAIGAAFGSYIDDFLAMLLATHFFNQVMKSYGISAIDCFHLQFTWKEIKPILIYSLKTGIPGLFTGSLGYIAFLLYVNYIPQYTTYTFLAVIGGSVGDVISWFGSTNITPLVSESYMNGKPELTKYYIGQDIRFNSLILFFFIPMILVIRETMPLAWVALRMERYLIALIFILPRLIRYSIERFFGQPGQVMYGANKPEFGIVVGLIHSVLDLGLKYIYLVIWAIPRRFGFIGTVLIMEFGHIPLAVIVAAINYNYVNKKIVKIRIPWIQILLGFGIPSFLTYWFLLLIKIIVYDNIFINYGFLLAFLSSLILFILILFFVFFPLTALFGGWDKTNVEEFRKAAQMSGPSRFLVIPVSLIIIQTCKISPLHDRFGMDTKLVIQNARELLILKHTARDLFKGKIKEN